MIEAEPLEIGQPKQTRINATASTIARLRRLGKNKLADEVESTLAGDGGEATPIGLNATAGLVAAVAQTADSIVIAETNGKIQYVNPAFTATTGYTTVQDVSDHKRTEEALRESEERFRNIADSCPTLMWVTDAEGATQFINRAYREFSGITYEIGKWRSLLHSDDALEYVQGFLCAVREHAPFRAEARIRRADGAWRLIGTYAEPRLSPGGEYLGHVGISADITDKRVAEEALRKSEAQYRLMAHALQSASDCISIADT
jgi:PAS domain S-box-containing protein